MPAQRKLLLCGGVCGGGVRAQTSPALISPTLTSLTLSVGLDCSGFVATPRTMKSHPSHRCVSLC